MHFLTFAISPTFFTFVGVPKICQPSQLQLKMPSFMGMCRIDQNISLGNLHVCARYSYNGFTQI